MNIHNATYGNNLETEKQQKVSELYKKQLTKIFGK